MPKALAEEASSFFLQFCFFVGGEHIDFNNVQFHVLLPFGPLPGVSSGAKCGAPPVGFVC
jgi:hypothetical protein